MRYCSIASGSSGNCHFVEIEGVRVLVDAGISMKALEKNLKQQGIDPKSIQAIFVTHEHSDHIKGVGAWSRKYYVPVFATAGTWLAMKKNGALGETDPSRNYGIKEGRGYRIGKMRIEPLGIFHDAQEPVGYIFTGTEDDPGKIVVMTDTGMVTPEMSEKISHANIIALESNHDVEMLMHGPYPYLLKKRIRSNNGHLSNEDCARICCQLLQEEPGCQIMLSHLSEENNRPETALETNLQIIREMLGTDRFDNQIRIAPRFEPSEFLICGPQPLPEEQMTLEE